MDILKSYEPKFQECVTSLRNDLSELRLGRATPVMVENIEVQVYGTKTRLRGLAAIAIPDSRTIVIQPWDRSNLEAIERALRSSPGGFAPVVEQATIRVQLQPLTEEKRQELRRLVGQKVEAARIRVRQLRDAVWSKIQDQARAKEISEDEKFRFKDNMEESVKRVGAQIRELEKHKEEELMRV